MNDDKAMQLMLKVGRDGTLNSGESYTGTLVAMLASRTSDGNTSVQAVLNVSNLSEGTVRKHLNRLGRRGLIVRHGDWIVPL
jgi:DNA-binding IscR family transcriptional regulator